MEKYYFIVNTGSASKKYALYLGNSRKFFAHLEKENGKYIATIEIGNKAKREKITSKDFFYSVSYVIKMALSLKLIADKKEISAIGFRVVAPGKYFLENKIINGNYLKKMRNASEEAPLHIQPMIGELKQLAKIFKGTPIFGISDSAFHSSIPDQARFYGLPVKTAENLEIMHFGYHGISFSSIVKKIKKLFGGKIPRKIIICHLGSGSSITAIRNGKSFDTSMGFTPLEGVLMSTRVGDIDSGAIIHLAEKLRLTPKMLEKYLYHECGLLGLSGKTGDIRELLKLEKAGDKKARLALEIFVYRIKKYIGAYVAALNGLDLLVFSATIGERSAVMRSRICKNLNLLGINLDKNKNYETVSRDGFISAANSSKVKIAVLITDEMSEIASSLLSLL